MRELTSTESSKLNRDLDWKTLRDIAQKECSNGSGFHQIHEDSWRQLVDRLTAKGYIVNANEVQEKKTALSPLAGEALLKFDPNYPTIDKVRYFDVIDDDFREASVYLNSQMFGGGIEQTYTELKRRYQEDENLHGLVYVIGRHRASYEAAKEKELMGRVVEGKYVVTVDIDKVLRNAQMSSTQVIDVLPECTCMSELQDDAYSPGGPMSGQKRPPPCELHSGKRAN